MRLAVVALVLAVVGSTGCDGDEEASLASSDESAARMFFKSHGFTRSESSCVIDALVGRIGADEFAAWLQPEEQGSGEEGDQEIGMELAESMGECGGINPEHTVCFGIFRSREEARQAAERASSAGFDDAGIGTGSNRRGPVPAVTFISGKTERAARPIQNGFRGFIERMGGTLGHPGSGCVEQPFFGA